ncbi:hypothetical protein KKH26_00065 [Patescibacteria group bacterium]|nr:hypothetical protein [Patescibacteria group bacterium]
MDETSPKKENKEELLMRRKDVWEKARKEAGIQEQKELEKGRISPEDEEVIRKQLRQEIETMELSEGLKEEAAKKAKKIEFLGEQEKLEHLIVIAKDKGVAFAVRVAKDMNSPYILDIFHDILFKDGFYKKFLESK